LYSLVDGSGLEIEHKTGAQKLGFAKN
jgi:hypothetical protein